MKMIPGVSVSADFSLSVAPSADDGIDMTLFTGAMKERRWLLTIDVQFLASDVSLWGAIPFGNPDDTDDIWGLHQDPYGKIPLGFIGTLGVGKFQTIVDGLGLYTRCALSVDGGLTQKASLDLGTLGGGLDTVVRAQVAGFGGESIVVAAIGDSGLGDGVTIEEVGTDITIHYESGVSTVQDVEDQITADATLIEVATPGTGATVLTSPADDFSGAGLQGGISHVSLTLTEILEAGRGN